MNVEDAVSLKDRYERELTETIGEFCNEFKRQTGISVTGVNVSMVDITGIGDGKRDAAVGRVELKVEL